MSRASPFLALHWGTSTSCKASLMPLPGEITCSGLLVLSCLSDLRRCTTLGSGSVSKPFCAFQSHNKCWKWQVFAGRFVLEKSRAFVVNRAQGQLGRHSPCSRTSSRCCSPHAGVLSRGPFGGNPSLPQQWRALFSGCSMGWDAIPLFPNVTGVSFCVFASISFAAFCRCGHHLIPVATTVFGCRGNLWRVVRASAERLE